MITLYSTGCPKCSVLKAKLDAKNIDYYICDDLNSMEQKGFMSVPMLETDDDIMDFSRAIAWVNSR